jgi:hypothetical protein
VDAAVDAAVDEAVDEAVDDIVVLGSRPLVILFAWQREDEREAILGLVSATLFAAFISYLFTWKTICMYISRGALILINRRR